MKRPQPRFKAGDRVTGEAIRKFIGDFAVIEGKPSWNGFTWMYGFENGNGLGLGEEYLTRVVEATQ